MSMDLAKALYAKMPDVFAKARKKFGRGLTLAEKILVSHADNFDSQNWERGKAMLDQFTHVLQRPIKCVRSLLEALENRGALFAERLQGFLEVGDCTIGTFQRFGHLLQRHSRFLDKAIEFAACILGILGS